MPIFVQMYFRLIQSHLEIWRTDGQFHEARMNLPIQCIEENFAGLRIIDRQSCYAQG